MKPIYIFILGCCFSQCFSQENAAESLSRNLHDQLIQKRRDNLIAGWSLLGCGVALAVGGFAYNLGQGIDDDTSNNNRGIAISYIGGAMALGSIPFFVWAHQNKRKAQLSLTGNTMTWNCGTEISPMAGLKVEF